MCKWILALTPDTGRTEFIILTKCRRVKKELFGLAAGTRRLTTVLLSSQKNTQRGPATFSDL
jgi:hypothetical protein